MPVVEGLEESLSLALDNAGIDGLEGRPDTTPALLRATVGGIPLRSAGEGESTLMASVFAVACWVAGGVFVSGRTRRTTSGRGTLEGRIRIS